ncbi:MAG: AarF/ABC1/UbiB kinase family protein [Dehalococcoidia bacterium]|nr:AarF/ABC1/UbiB kinase family protein [Dehalococcoidia bacterium]
MDCRSTSISTRARGHSRHIGRYRQIALVLVKHRLKNVIQTLGLEGFLPLRWMPPGNPFSRENYPQPVRMRMALEELGTTFVKLGQILSTRVDLLPSDFVSELSKLQSSLHPIPLEAVHRVVREELGRPVDQVYASFSEQPLGVASIGQAHAATLHDGTEVVVKVRKPGVVEQVNEDVAVLRQLAVVAAKRWEGAQEYDLAGIVKEIGEALAAEMDYVREGHNAEHFARFFHGDSSIHIPKIYWEYTTSRVITMERIQGISTRDTHAMEEASIDREDIAKRSVNIWLKMVFEDRVFHADPHPGNLFVEKDGRLGLIDFGMIGVVDDEIRQSLGGLIQALLGRDAEQLVDSLVDLGVMGPETSREQLRADIKHLLSHFPDLSVERLRSNLDLEEFLEVVRSNHMQLPGNTFLLLKTVIMAQSLGKVVDPNFDIVPSLQSHVARLFRKKYSPVALAKRMPRVGLDMMLLGMDLPRRINRVVKSMERGELKIRTDVSGLERHLEHLERLVNRLVIGLVLASVILGLAIVVLAFKLSP